MRYEKFLSPFLALLLLLAGCTSDAQTRVPSSTAHVHNYTQTVVKPSYTHDGYTLHKCVDCGYEYQGSATQMPTEVVSYLAQKDYLQPFADFSRQRTENPEFVMVHFTSAVVLSKDDPYNMETVRSIFVDYKVSVHYIIDRDGSISCYVPEDLVAYHAGYGTWQDDPKYADNLNNYSIGIELVAIGSQKDMAQYLTAAEYDKLPKAWLG